MNTIQSRAGGKTVGTTLRMSRELHDEMKIQAIKAGRSFNTHVVMLLKEAIPADAQRPQS
ncbi:toxin-antitoxin system HicB family antitoxin [Paracoccus aminovorans]|uniref:toxin-antitoxin system HicB family antitoxin n=1 Tax=Paracoccus aminovorans TaxID=34004 RepID=UPI000A6E5817|nr:toxin-antitoxin system HicB family antitoxin [Paracoccus aminovorans]MDQ7775880.1 toxin-antitoxin system HicB family antitoxin [Paracoccus aminovorans]